jgi:hypothetical protein
MSIWIRTFCPRPLGALDLKMLRDGIVQRLPLLTALFCPEHEEDPHVVINRLRIVLQSDNVVEFHYRADTEDFLDAERWSGPDATTEVAEHLEELESVDESTSLARVRDVLRRTVETIGFELKLSDAQGMGWPLAIAAAVKLAEATDGIVHAEESGWWVADGNEVELVLPDYA